MSSTQGNTSLHWGDILVITAYFCLSIGIGLWTMCKSNSGSVHGFFLAGRNMIWWPVGMSLFASNIGSNNFVGTAGTGAISGMAVIMFEWSAVFLLIMLGWIFLPVYIASGIYTMPEYLQRRFGGERLRVYLSIVAVMTYLFSTVSVDLYTGALFIQQTIGWNIYIGVAVTLSISVVYTALGGLRTVIFTDAMAVIIMLAGGFTICIIGMVKIGGYEALKVQYKNALPATTYAAQGNTTCGIPREDAFHIFRNLDADYPWFGTLTRTLLGSVWYWCANQVLVQRALAAKNINHAKAACILAAYMKLMPMFIIVWPGMISRALFPDEVACADPAICAEVCENEVGCSSIAYPKLVQELLPAGLRGLMIACMLAAVISSLTSIYNSSATLFALDLWPKLRSTAKEGELLMVSRVFVIVLTGIAIAMIPMMESANGGEIFRYATTVTGYLGAPTCAMFLLAMFWHRVSETGAFWGMVSAQIFGLVRFVLELIYPEPACYEEDTRISFLKDLNSYDYTIIQIAVAFVMIVSISMLTEPPKENQLNGLTFWKRYLKPQKDCEEEQQQKLCADVQNETSTHKSEADIHSETYSPESEQKWYYRIPCIDPPQNNNTSQKIKEDHQTRMNYLTQTSFWRWFLNIQAVLVCGVCVFLYGFFH